MFQLAKSTRSDKKFMVKTPDGKTVHFGASGYDDFTIHKDEQRKQRYISRHQSNENWYISGVDTAGFWSRWLLWNKPTIKESLDDIRNTFQINVKYDSEGDNMKLISFNQAVDMLKRGQFTKFFISPEYQVVRKSNTNNYIGDFLDHNKNIYLVELRYDPSTNQIFPPV
jgi:hypothetical protein